MCFSWEGLPRPYAVLWVPLYLLNCALIHLVPGCPTPISAELRLPHVTIWASLGHRCRCHGLQLQGGAAISFLSKAPYIPPSTSMSPSLRDLGSLNWFPCIILICARYEVIIKPNCLGHLLLSLLFNHSHIMMGNIQYGFLWESGSLPQAMLLEILNPPNMSMYLKTSSR